jgi:hypothetical protein
MCLIYQLRKKLMAFVRVSSKYTGNDLGCSLRIKLYFSACMRRVKAPLPPMYPEGIWKLAGTWK